MSPGTTPRLIASGQALACRPRPNGRWLRAEDLIRRRSRGAMNFSPAGSTAAMSGKGYFPTITRPTTAISAPRRFMLSSQTDTACTMCAAMSGNGARTISRRDIITSPRQQTLSIESMRRTGQCAEGRSSAMNPTAIATASGRVAQTRQTARQATLDFGSSASSQRPERGFGLQYSRDYALSARKSRNAASNSCAFSR